MHAMLFMHFVFGTFLVYTGIKTLTADDEDEADRTLKQKQAEAKGGRGVEC